MSGTGEPRRASDAAAALLGDNDDDEEEEEEEEAQTFGASPNVHLTFLAQTYPDFYNAWKRA